LALFINYFNNAQGQQEERGIYQVLADAKAGRVEKIEAQSGNSEILVTYRDTRAKVRSRIESNDSITMLLVQAGVPLDAVNVEVRDALLPAQRAMIAAQLSEILRRAYAFYQATGSMPDLYGQSARNSDERKSRKSIPHLPQRLWSFLVERTLLRSHNLVLIRDPEYRIVLIDYDPVRRGRLYRLTYFAVRRLLLLRDLAVLAWLRLGWLT